MEGRPKREYGTSMLVFHCSCGHRNQAHRSVRESYRLYILDQLPNCKKCDRSMRKSQFRVPRTRLFEQIEREIMQSKA